MTAKEACELSKVSEQELMQVAIASIERDISEACKKGLYEIRCTKYFVTPEIKKYFEDLGYSIEECAWNYSNGEIRSETYISWCEEDI